MRVGNGKVGFMEKRRAYRHPRMKGAGPKHEGLVVDLSPFPRLELAWQCHIQVGMPRTYADAAAQCGVDMAQQGASVFIHPEIQGDIEMTLTNFAKLIQA